MPWWGWALLIFPGPHPTILCWSAPQTGWDILTRLLNRQALWKETRNLKVLRLKVCPWKIHFIQWGWLNKEYGESNGTGGIGQTRFKKKTKKMPAWSWRALTPKSQNVPISCTFSTLLAPWSSSFLFSFTSLTLERHHNRHQYQRSRRQSGSLCSRCDLKEMLAVFVQTTNALTHTHTHAMCPQFLLNRILSNISQNDCKQERNLTSHIWNIGISGFTVAQDVWGIKIHHDNPFVFFLQRYQN